MNPYKYDKTYRVKAWTIRINEQDHLAVCKRSGSLYFIISDDTDVIRGVPQYVKDFLLKIGFLDKWRDAQVRKSVERIRQRIANFQDMQKKRSPKFDTEGYG